MTVLYGPDGKPISVVVGNVAHDAVDSGNPVKIGGKAYDFEAMPASVAPGDRVDAAYSPKGVAAVALFDPGSSLPLTDLPVSIASSITITPLPAGTANIGDVDVLSSALPTGAATAANQATEIGHLDGVEGILTTMDADTGGILTAVQTLDNAISGSEMQVDVVAALPAGTNNIGDVDVVTLPALVAGSANIGDVDVLTVPADPFGANADAVVAAGAVGSIQAKLRRLTTDIDAIKTSVAAATPAGTNNIGDVDVLTLPALVAGTANIGDVDVLTVPADPFGATADAVVAAGATGSISAKLRRTTQGLEDLKTGIILAAGSAAIGKLAANSGVDIGDVDVTSSATLANGQVNVTNSAATLVAARTGRKRLTLVNRQVAPVFIGIATVTTANGFQIDAGASLTLETSALIQGITAAASGATEKVFYIEEYT